MHRLNGLESAFLLVETGTQNANTGCLMRLKPDDDQHPVTLDALRDHIASRLDLAPVLRWRLYDVPLGLHHPMLADDPDFQLDRHLGEMTLEAPADQAALHRAFAAATTQSFVRPAPLWRMTLVHGLDDGSQALFFIFHHVLMDGVAYIATLEALCTDAPERPPYARPFAPEQWGRGRLLRSGVKDLSSLWRGVPRFVREVRRGRRAMAARIAETSDEIPVPSAVRLPLNPLFAPSLDRSFATVDLPFTEVRDVRRAGDVTINTVLLTVVATSFRRYLLRRGQLPQDPLIAGVMASTEPVDAPPRPNGNKFANFVVSVATDLDDPWAQMQSISAATAEGKLRLERLGIDIEDRFLNLIPPVVGTPLVRHQHKSRPPQQMRASFTFSNVRGAAGYHFLGASVTGLYTYGPVSDAVGIFIASTNLGDSFHIAVNANPSALEDAEELATSFKDTLRELVLLAEQRSAPSV